MVIFIFYYAISRRTIIISYEDENGYNLCFLDEFVKYSAYARRGLGVLWNMHLCAHDQDLHGL